MDYLLEAVRDLIAELAAEIDAAAPAAQARVSAAQTAREEAARLARELTEVDQSLTRMAIARVQQSNEVMPQDAWANAVEELTSRRVTLRQRLAAAEAEAASVSADPAPPLAGILEGWEILPAPALNRLLRTVIRKITVRCLAPAQRDEKGHFMPQDTEIKVVPLWAPQDA